MPNLLDGALFLMLFMRFLCWVFFFFFFFFFFFLYLFVCSFFVTIFSFSIGILLADALEFCLRGSVEVYLDNPTEKPIYVPPEEEESEEEDELLMEGAESYEEEEWGIRQSLMRGFQ